MRMSKFILCLCLLLAAVVASTTVKGQTYYTETKALGSEEFGYLEIESLSETSCQLKVSLVASTPVIGPNSYHYTISAGSTKRIWLPMSFAGNSFDVVVLPEASTTTDCKIQVDFTKKPVPTASLTSSTSDLEQAFMFEIVTGVADATKFTELWGRFKFTSDDGMTSFPIDFYILEGTNGWVKLFDSATTFAAETSKNINFFENYVKAVTGTVKIIGVLDRSVVPVDSDKKFDIKMEKYSHSFGSVVDITVAGEEKTISANAGDVVIVTVNPGTLITDSSFHFVLHSSVESGFEAAVSTAGAYTFGGDMAAVTDFMVGTDRIHFFTSERQYYPYASTDKKIAFRIKFTATCSIKTHFYVVDEVKDATKIKIGEEKVFKLDQGIIKHLTFSPKDLVEGETYLLTIYSADSAPEIKFWLGEDSNVAERNHAVTACYSDPTVIISQTITDSKWSLPLDPCFWSSSKTYWMSLLDKKGGFQFPKEITVGLHRVVPQELTVEDPVEGELVGTGSSIPFIIKPSKLNVNSKYYVNYNGAGNSIKFLPTNIRQCANTPSYLESMTSFVPACKLSSDDIMGYRGTTTAGGFASVRLTESKPNIVEKVKPNQKMVFNHEDQYEDGVIYIPIEIPENLNTYMEIVIESNSASSNQILGRITDLCTDFVDGNKFSYKSEYNKMITVVNMRDIDFTDTPRSDKIVFFRMEVTSTSVLNTPVVFSYKYFSHPVKSLGEGSSAAWRFTDILARTFKITPSRKGSAHTMKYDYFYLYSEADSSATLYYSENVDPLTHKTEDLSSFQIRTLSYSGAAAHLMEPCTRISKSTLYYSVAGSFSIADNYPLTVERHTYTPVAVGVDPVHVSFISGESKHFAYLPVVSDVPEGSVLKLRVQSEEAFTINIAKDGYYGSSCCSKKALIDTGAAIKQYTYVFTKAKAAENIKFLTLSGSKSIEIYYEIVSEAKTYKTFAGDFSDAVSLEATTAVHYQATFPADKLHHIVQMKLTPIAGVAVIGNDDFRPPTVQANVMFGQTTRSVTFYPQDAEETDDARAVYLATMSIPHAEVLSTDFKMTVGFTQFYYLNLAVKLDDSIAAETLNVDTKLMNLDHKIRVYKFTPPTTGPSVTYSIRVNTTKTTLADFVVAVTYGNYYDKPILASFSGTEHTFSIKQMLVAQPVYISVMFTPTKWRTNYTVESKELQIKVTETEQEVGSFGSSVSVDSDKVYWIEYTVDGSLMNDFEKYYGFQMTTVKTAATVTMYLADSTQSYFDATPLASRTISKDKVDRWIFGASGTVSTLNFLVDPTTKIYFKVTDFTGHESGASFKVELKTDDQVTLAEGDNTITAGYEDVATLYEGIYSDFADAEYIWFELTCDDADTGCAVYTYNGIPSGTNLMGSGKKGIIPVAAVVDSKIYFMFKGSKNMAIKIKKMKTVAKSITLSTAAKTPSTSFAVKFGEIPILTITKEADVVITKMEIATDTSTKTAQMRSVAYPGAFNALVGTCSDGCVIINNLGISRSDSTLFNANPFLAGQGGAMVFVPGFEDFDEEVTINVDLEGKIADETVTVGTDASSGSSTSSKKVYKFLMPANVGVNGVVRMRFNGVNIENIVCDADTIKTREIGSWSKDTTVWKDMIFYNPSIKTDTLSNAYCWFVGDVAKHEFKDMAIVVAVTDMTSATTMMLNSGNPVYLFHPTITTINVKKQAWTGKIQLKNTVALGNAGATVVVTQGTDVFGGSLAACEGDNSRECVIESSDRRDVPDTKFGFLIYGPHSSSEDDVTQADMTFTHTVTDYYKIKPALPFVCKQHLMATDVCQDACCDYNVQGINGITLPVIKKFGYLVPASGSTEFSVQPDTEGEICHIEMKSGVSKPYTFSSDMTQDGTGDYVIDGITSEWTKVSFASMTPKVEVTTENGVRFRLVCGSTPATTCECPVDGCKVRHTVNERRGYGTEVIVHTSMSPFTAYENFPDSTKTTTFSNNGHIYTDLSVDYLKSSVSYWYFTMGFDESITFETTRVEALEEVVMNKRYTDTVVDQRKYTLTIPENPQDGYYIIEFENLSPEYAITFKMSGNPGTYPNLNLADELQILPKTKVLLPRTASTVHTVKGSIMQLSASKLSKYSFKITFVGFNDFKTLSRNTEHCMKSVKGHYFYKIDTSIDTETLSVYGAVRNIKVGSIKFASADYVESGLYMKHNMPSDTPASSALSSTYTGTYSKGNWILIHVDAQDKVKNNGEFCIGSTTTPFTLEIDATPIPNSEAVSVAGETFFSALKAHDLNPARDIKFSTLAEPVPYKLTVPAGVDGFKKFFGVHFESELSIEGSFYGKKADGTLIAASKIEFTVGTYKAYAFMNVSAGDELIFEVKSSDSSIYGTISQFIVDTSDIFATMTADTVAFRKAVSSLVNIYEIDVTSVAAGTHYLELSDYAEATLKMYDDHFRPIAPPSSSNAVVKSTTQLMPWNVARAHTDVSKIYVIATYTNRNTYNGLKYTVKPLTITPIVEATKKYPIDLTTTVQNMLFFSVDLSIFKNDAAKYLHFVEQNAATAIVDGVKSEFVINARNSFDIRGGFNSMKPLQFPALHPHEEKMYITLNFGGLGTTTRNIENVYFTIGKIASLPTTREAAVTVGGTDESHIYVFSTPSPAGMYIEARDIAITGDVIGFGVNKFGLIGNPYKDMKLRNAENLVILSAFDDIQNLWTEKDWNGDYVQPYGRTTFTLNHRAYAFSRKNLLVVVEMLPENAAVMTFKVDSMKLLSRDQISQSGCPQKSIFYGTTTTTEEAFYSIALEKVRASEAELAGSKTQFVDEKVHAALTTYHCDYFVPYYDSKGFTVRAPLSHAEEIIKNAPNLFDIETMTGEFSFPTKVPELQTVSEKVVVEVSTSTTLIFIILSVIVIIGGVVFEKRQQSKAE
ncbi:hypothetical protein PCE1_003493 [Barthelona sp. PCE]